MRKTLMVVLLMMGVQFNAQADEVTMLEQEVGGNVVEGRLHVPEGADIADGVVLITHGTLAHMDMELIATMQRLLAERGIPSLTHTLSIGQDRRKGMYDCTVTFRGTMEGDSAEVAAWAHWLKHNGAGDLYLMGHSRGGGQVARVARDLGADVVAGVIMLAPNAGGTHEGVLASYEQRTNVSLSSILEEAEGLVSEGRSDTVMNLPRFMSCATPEVTATAEAIMSYYGPAASAKTDEVIAATDMPIMIILGADDDVVGDVASRLGHVVDGARVQMEVIPDAGHFFYDFAAEDVADVIAEFVEELG